MLFVLGSTPAYNGSVSRHWASEFPGFVWRLASLLQTKSSFPSSRTAQHFPPLSSAGFATSRGGGTEGLVALIFHGSSVKIVLCSLSLLSLIW